MITDEKNITPKIIEEILQKMKSLEQVEVKRVKIRDRKSTITSKTCFLDVTYSEKSPKNAPNHFFLKITNEGFFAESGKNEVFFYNTIANQIDNIPVLKCYDAKFDETTGTAQILLEDLSKTHFQTEFPIPPSDINCKKHIEGLGKLHSLWWGDERLDYFLGKNHWTKQYTLEEVLTFKKKMAQEFLKFMGDRISNPRKNILTSTVELAVKNRWKCYKEGKNLTLCHGDAHAWNAFYPKNSNDGKSYLIDWQSVSAYKGVYDIAYFMGLHWSPNRRKRLEKGFLRIYYELLEKSGITNYSWVDCYDDYRRAIVDLLHFVVIWQWSTKQIPAIVWWSHFERLMNAFDDLNCSELI